MDNPNVLWRLRSRELGFAILLVMVIFGVSYYQLKLGEAKSRDARRRDDTEVVARALREYYREHEEYPMEEGGDIVSCGNKGVEVCKWGDDSIVDDDSVMYLEKMPTDPFTDRGYKYVYEVNEERTKFRVYARLENTKDPAVKPNQRMECAPGLACNWFAGD